MELEKSALEIEYASGGVLALFLENFYELASIRQDFTSPPILSWL